MLRLNVVMESNDGGATWKGVATHPDEALALLGSLGTFLSTNHRSQIGHREDQRQGRNRH